MINGAGQLLTAVSAPVCDLHLVEEQEPAEKEVIIKLFLIYDTLKRKNRLGEKLNLSV